MILKMSRNRHTTIWNIISTCYRIMNHSSSSYQGPKRSSHKGIGMAHKIDWLVKSKPKQAFRSNCYQKDFFLKLFNGSFHTVHSGYRGALNSFGFELLCNRSKLAKNEAKGYSVLVLSVMCRP